MRTALLAAVVVMAAGFPGPSAQVLRGDLVLTLSVDREAYALGESVQMTLEVRNRGTSPLTFQFPTSQRYDFVVTRQDGTLVWQWSHDKAFAQVFGSLTLDPGEARVYRERWDQRDNEGRLVSPGWYMVEGLFPPERVVGPIRLYTPRPRVMIRIGPGRAEAAAYRKVFRPGHVRVRFFPWVPSREIERLLRSLDLVVVSVDPAGFYVVRVQDQEDVWDVVEALNRSPLVEWAIPDYVLVRRP